MSATPHATNPISSYDNPNPGSSYAGSDPDADDGDQDQDVDAGGSGEPPKKKRRRQALSCTECKRRKIRCDRKQPCAPCVRRGDQAKCQWHVVESVAEKYVPRAEHDALRARVDTLEAFIARLPPAVLAAMPPLPLAFGSSDSPNFNAPTSTIQQPLFSSSFPGFNPSSYSPPGQGGFGMTSHTTQSLPPMHSLRPPTPPGQPIHGMGPPPQGFSPHVFQSSQGQGGSEEGGIAPAQTQYSSVHGGRRSSGAGASASHGAGGSSGERAGARGGGRRRASASTDGQPRGGNRGQPHRRIAPMQVHSRDSEPHSASPVQLHTVFPQEPQRPSSLSGESQSQTQSTQQRALSPLQSRPSGGPPSGQWGTGFGSFPPASGVFPSAGSPPSSFSTSSSFPGATDRRESASGGNGNGSFSVKTASTSITGSSSSFSRPGILLHTRTASTSTTGSTHTRSASSGSGSFPPSSSPSSGSSFSSFSSASPFSAPNSDLFSFASPPLFSIRSYPSHFLPQSGRRGGPSRPSVHDVTHGPSLAVHAVVRVAALPSRFCGKGVPSLPACWLQGSSSMFRRLTTPTKIGPRVCPQILASATGDSSIPAGARVFTTVGQRRRPRPRPVSARRGRARPRTRGRKARRARGERR